MAKIANVHYKVFREDAKDKNIVLWGAGRLAAFYIRTFCKNLRVVAIIDNNEKLNGTELIVDEVSYHVMGVKIWLDKMSCNSQTLKETVLFITPTSYVLDIIEQINQIVILSDITCYVGILMRDLCESSPFTFTQGEDKIPKKIHYCWFGGKEIPDKLKRYMSTWEKYCPDYEIIRWDEHNYDICKNRYMREAYESKQWGFVPDYARLDIIYNEGGIYLDTDVELLTSLDDLRKDEMFCGFGCNYIMNLGCGFGAVRKHWLVKEFLEYYDTQSFYLKDGTLNKKTCYEYQHPILLRYDFQLENRFQRREGVVIYPSDVLSPEGGGLHRNYSSNSVAVHHCVYSWATDEERKGFELLKEGAIISERV